MKSFSILLFLFFTSLSFSQSLKENDYLYFLGSYGIKDSSYQIGIYITVKKNDSIHFKIQVAKNWETIGKNEFYLNLVKKSLTKNKFKIKNNKKKYPAYKFVNDEGIELLILKEGNGLAKLKIPPKLIFGVKAPKILYQK